MAQLFPPSFNTLSKVSIFGGLIFAGVVGFSVLELGRTPWITQVEIALEQPVPFSHKHHLQGVGIDCRYCHTTVEESSFAGIPASKTCMSCHSQVWKDAPILEPIRASYRDDKPMEWVRVHDLPEFVYFNHSIHVKKGVGCESCHGRVDTMPLMYRQNTLNMEWCLACHREPEKHLRPRSEITTMGWDPLTALGKTQAELGAELKQQYDVQSLTNCSICHR